MTNIINGKLIQRGPENKYKEELELYYLCKNKMNPCQGRLTTLKNEMINILYIFGHVFLEVVSLNKTQQIVIQTQKCRDATVSR